ncbi:MAG: polysaccharide biosynthesis protein PslH [Acidobacteriota bacterium]|jgi:glycosyltransferase involved in cell wall biosynthesis|nr:polysaccharide biosynthesis protein PslH [Acidobacteriota bacterium]
MRILQLTPRIAWPPTDGGRVVMLQVALSLQRLGADVEILSLNPRKQRVDADDLPLPLEAIDIDTSAHVAAFLRSFSLRAPQLVARFYSPRFESSLRRKLRERDFDVVQLESPFLLPYLRAIRESSNARVVLRSLNVEFRIWERLAEHEPGFVKRVALRAIARSLRRYELAQLNACDAIVPITELDANDFRALGCTRPMYVLPGGVDPQPVDRRNESPNAVGFLGSLDYRPNQEAAIWIAEELRPRLRRDAELHIAGSRAPEWLRARLAASGVVFSGEVPDAAAFIGWMRVMIAPIYSGGGMRIKILAAMAAGKPVVSTTIGAEGIDVVNGENIVVADEVEAFTTSIESLLDDEARAHAIGDAAHALVATRYSTDALTQGFLAFCEELTKSGDVRGGR